MKKQKKKKDKEIIVSTKGEEGLGMSSYSLNFKDMFNISLPKKLQKTMEAAITIRVGMEILSEYRSVCK